jgi:hypothetical protein
MHFIVAISKPCVVLRNPDPSVPLDHEPLQADCAVFSFIDTVLSIYSCWSYPIRHVTKISGIRL